MPSLKPDGSPTDSDRAQGVLFAVALLGLLVAAFTIAVFAIPHITTDGSTGGVESESTATAADLSIALNESNVETLATGYDSSATISRPADVDESTVRSLVGDEAWRNADANTKNALLKYVEQLAERLESREAEGGTLTEIQTTDSGHPATLGTRVNYIGNFDDQGSSPMTLATDVNETYDATIGFAKVMLPKSESDSVTLVAEDTTGTQWTFDIWVDTGSDTIKYRENDGSTGSVSSSAIYVDFRNGVVNGGAAPLNSEFADPLSEDYDITLEYGSANIGQVALLIDGDSPISASESSDLTAGSKSRSTDMVAEASFQYVYDTAGSTNTGSVDYSAYELGREGAIVGSLDYTSEFEVEITDAPSEIDTGDDYIPEITVTNTGSVTDTQPISLDIRGGPGVVDAETITLDPGESQRLDGNGFYCIVYGYCDPHLSWATTSYDRGSYTVAVESETDTTTTSLDVLAPANFEIEILEASTYTYNSGNREAVSTELRVTNTGDKSDRQSVEYGFDDPSSSSDWNHIEWVSLSGGESWTYEFATGDIGGVASTYHIRSDDDEDTENIDTTGTDSDSGSPGNPGSTSITFDAEDVEVNDVSTATVTRVDSRSGSTYGPNEFISGNDEVEGFAFKDMSVWGASGAVNLWGESLAAGGGTRDETIRYRGSRAGTGELAGGIWSHRYDANLAPGDDTDTFTVEPEGGGGDDGEEFPGNGDDDEDSGTGGFDGTIEFPG